MGQENIDGVEIGWVGVRSKMTGRNEVGNGTRTKRMVCNTFPCHTAASMPSHSVPRKGLLP